jgi:hypothetical protein
MNVENMLHDEMLSVHPILKKTRKLLEVTLG